MYSQSQLLLNLVVGIFWKYFLEILFGGGVADGVIYYLFGIFQNDIYELQLYYYRWYRGIYLLYFGSLHYRWSCRRSYLRMYCYATVDATTLFEFRPRAVSIGVCVLNLVHSSTHARTYYYSCTSSTVVGNNYCMSMQQNCCVAYLFEPHCTSVRVHAMIVLQYSRVPGSAHYGRAAGLQCSVHSQCVHRLYSCECIHTAVCTHVRRVYSSDTRLVQLY